MRFASKSVDGFQVFAVTGVNTVSFGITATKAARKGLLGFSVDRARDGSLPKPISGFKVFKSIIPEPKPRLRISTYDHPIQSLVWDDFTLEPGAKYRFSFRPLRGEPGLLDRSAQAIDIDVQAELLFSEGKAKHDIFFNRGVASSQAYEREFGNKKPDELPAAERQRALDWLSRELDEAILEFIKSAKKGDSLRGCFYEFRYSPVLDELKKAITRGVDVQCIVDMKENEYTDKDGVFHESFPRVENEAAIKKAKLPADSIVRREARTSHIQHNKFLVLLKAGKPKEVWTGSTNLSLGGIHGQTNVGHWVRDAAVAKQFIEYWNLLATDPGGQEGESAADVKKHNKELREAVEEISDVPASVKAIPKGVTSLFSPRTNLDALDLYVDILDKSKKAGCITLAFGVGKAFKDALKDNTSKSAVTFMLLEKEDKPNSRSKEPFVRLDASENVYLSWGSYLPGPAYQWARETNARSLQFNSHVVYIHSKFLLADPLGADPIVVTGSANFSDASTKENDENMLIIRGDRRVADIYFTEFNRLFNHYFFRSMQQRTNRSAEPSSFNRFLREDDSWLDDYKPGSLRQKRVDLYASMAGT